MWKESLTWIVPWVRSVPAGDFGRLIQRLQTLRSWRRWTHRKSTQKDYAKEVIFHKKNGKFIFSNRRWTNQTWRSRLENIHLDMAATNSRRKSSWFSWRIRRVSTSTTSRLVSGCRWNDKRFLVHVGKLHIPPSRWTQSQVLLSERRIIPCSTEIHWRIQNYKNEFGCYARKPHRWLLEYRWVNRFVWFMDRFHSVFSIRWEISRRIYVVRVRLTKRQATLRPDHLWTELWKSMG